MNGPAPGRGVGMLVASLLALTTASAILLLAESLRSPILLAPTSGQSADVGVARRFYGAVNDVLTSGSTRGLDDIVDENLVEHPRRSGPDGPRASMARSLLALRAMYPDVGLAMDWVSPVESGMVAASVRVVGGERESFLGMPLPREMIGAGWGPIEQLRIERGRVVERWGSEAGGTTLEPLAEVELASPVLPSPRVLALLRVRLEEGTTIEVINGLYSRIFVLEEGTVSIREDEPSGAPDVGFGSAEVSPTTTEPSISKDLRASAPLVTLPGSRLTVANLGAGPTSLLVIVRYSYLSGPTTQTAASDIIGRDVLALEAMFPAGMSVEVLGESLVDAGAEAWMFLGRIDMSTGSRLTWPATSGTLMIACDRGNVSVDTNLGDLPLSDAEGHANASAVVEAGSHLTLVAAADSTVIVLAMTPLPGLATPAAERN